MSKRKGREEACFDAPSQAEADKMVLEWVKKQPPGTTVIKCDAKGLVGLTSYETVVTYEPAVPAK